MAYTKYSLTPADNNSAPPDGAPEGMLPSAVNDTMRDMMSQIRDVGDGIRGGTYTMTAPVITGGSINGAAIGASTASTGAFTTLSASSTVSGTGFSNYFASPPALGGTAAAAVSSTNLSYTGTLTGGTGVVNLGSGQLYKDASGNVGIGSSSVNGLTVSKYGSQWTNNTTNTYPVPAGNIFAQFTSIAAADNWFGMVGNYGNSSGSANLLLQANLNNTNQQAGNYIASQVTSSTTADLVFGRMIGGATTGGNATKSEQLRINNNGNIALQGATTNAGGVGITFPATQVASSDANCLDDYEEGTWTPVGNNVTLIGVSGWYTKIGNVVSVGGQWTYPVTANATSAQVSGLPFTSANIVSNFVGTVSITDYGLDNLYPFTATNDTIILVRNNANSALNNVNLSGKFITFMATYRV